MYTSFECLSRLFSVKNRQPVHVTRLVRIHCVHVICGEVCMYDHTWTYCDDYM